MIFERIKMKTFSLVMRQDILLHLSLLRQYSCIIHCFLLYLICSCANPLTVPNFVFLFICTVCWKSCIGHHKCVWSELEMLLPICYSALNLRSEHHWYVRNLCYHKTLSQHRPKKICLSHQVVILHFILLNIRINNMITLPVTIYFIIVG